MSKMTKSQFEEMFRAEILPRIAEHERVGFPDKPRRRQAWNDTINAYIRNRALPEAAGNWSHPRWLETARVKGTRVDYSTQKKTAKKSSAQLDREIAEALNSKKSKRSGHSTIATAASTKNEIIGFEFLVDHDGQRYWTRLQGSGGQFGAGSLHAVHNLGPKTRRVQALCSKLLSQAREELRREGTIRSYQDHEDPARRIRPVAASAVLKCRPIVG